MRIASILTVFDHGFDQHAYERLDLTFSSTAKGHECPRVDCCRLMEVLFVLPNLPCSILGTHTETAGKTELWWLQNSSIDLGGTSVNLKTPILAVRIIVVIELLETAHNTLESLVRLDSRKLDHFSKLKIRQFTLILVALRSLDETFFEKIRLTSSMKQTSIGKTAAFLPGTSTQGKFGYLSMMLYCALKYVATS